MDAVLLALAAVWGAATGLLIPRAAYRFAVEPESPGARRAPPATRSPARPAAGSARPDAPLAPPMPTRPPRPPRPPRPSRSRNARPETAGLARPTAPAPEPQALTAPPAPAPEPQASPAPPPSVTTAPPGYAPGALAPLVTVLVCVALAAATGARPELVGWLVLAPVAVLLAVVDRRVHRLPDVLTLPLAAAAVLLLGGAALLPGTPDPGPPGCWAAWLSAASTSCSS